jgi:hypothetical protein
MRWYSSLALLMVTALPACAATNKVATSQPYAAVTYIHETRADPPLHLHIVIVDLTDPRVHVVTPRGGRDPDGDGPWQPTLPTVRATAQQEGLAIAVNGDYFMPKDSEMILGRKVPYFIGNWANVCGWAMSDGALWSARPCACSLVVDEQGRIRIGKIDRPPEGARQIVSSLQQVVTDGQNTGVNLDRAPRTAAGIDAAGKRLVLLVADGRRPDFSGGLTFLELGDEMIRLGCRDALSLDGGGSSTLVIRSPRTHTWNVINRPSDGHDLLIPLSIERAVANVLGIKIEGVPATQPITAPQN